MNFLENFQRDKDYNLIYLFLLKFIQLWGVHHLPIAEWPDLADKNPELLELDFLGFIETLILKKKKSTIYLKCKFN